MLLLLLRVRGCAGARVRGCAGAARGKGAGKGAGQGRGARGVLAEVGSWWATVIAS